MTCASTGAASPTCWAAPALSDLTALFVGGAIVLHLVAWPAVLWLEPHVHGDGATIMPLATAVFCIFTWMVAQGLFGVTRTLYDRGDLDLLLGSPLPAARILAAKAAAIAASTLGSIGLLVIPLANVGALLGNPAWLAIYPTLIALALIATSLGLGLSIGLFFLLGPRRARLYTQMTGAVIAGAFVLGAQIVAILPLHMRDAIIAWFARRGPRTGIMRDAVFLPVDAALGDGRAVVVLLAAGLGLFALAVNVLATRFAGATLAASGAPSESDRTRRRRAARPLPQWPRPHAPAQGMAAAGARPEPVRAARPSDRLHDPDRGGAAAQRGAADGAGTRADHRRHRRAGVGVPRLAHGVRRGRAGADRVGAGSSVARWTAPSSPPWRCRCS